MTDYSKLVYDYLEANKNLPDVYTFQYEEKTFIGLNKVFSPIVFEDTFFFCENIPFSNSNKILEIGCGTGLISVNLALKKTYVTATDINKFALKNTQINALLHNVEDRIKTITSNVFDNISVQKKYDVIFWNAPFIFNKSTQMDLLECSVFDSLYNGIRKYITEYNSYLSNTGKAFIGFSSSSGDVHLLNQICLDNNVQLILVAKKNLDIEFSVELYELRKIN